MSKTMRKIICAHRGLDDRVPENTLEAFESALKRGMAIEFDVQMTIDNQLVIMHDQTVDRTTDGSGRVSQLNLDDLKTLDAGRWFGPQFAGQRVPTFDEALEVVSSQAQVSPSIALDVKQVSGAVIKMICDGIQKHGLIDDVIGIGALIGSAHVRQQFCEVLSRFQCAAVAETRGDLDTALGDVYSKWVYARFVPTAEDVQLVNRAGKRLIVCGTEVSQDVNRAHDAYRAGPDMVLTSHPSRLAELVGLAD
jgi:glycerophosphoryl diester phosphodiesterase